jgi:hypothetical protein
MVDELYGALFSNFKKIQILNIEKIQKKIHSVVYD